MTTVRPHVELIHEGAYVAQVDVEWIESDTGWSPCLSLDDVRKLENVREALRAGDLKRASQFARVYQLLPVSA